MHAAASKARATGKRSGCMAAAGAGMLVTEVAMGKYAFGLSARQGAVELLKTGTQSRALIDWYMRWNGGGIIFSNLTMTAGDRIDMGEQIAGYCISQYGLPSSTSYPWGFYTGPAAGFVDLVDPTGRSVDFVRWGGNVAAPYPGGAWTETSALSTPAEAKSLGRFNAATPDTNSAGDWCQQERSLDNPNSPCLGP
jgi:hypothetical protein